MKILPQMLQMGAHVKVIHPPARRLAGILLFVFILPGCSRKAGPAHHPNVLIITVDTLRADRLGVYGEKEPLTPNIDALARDGVVFEHAVSQVPLTYPSHTAIFTGTYPFSNGVRDFTAQPLSKNFRTLAESFKANGYATGAVVSSFVLDRSWGLARGFDFYDDAFSGEQYVSKDLGLVERRADASVDHAIAWLANHSNQPFFFWLHLYDPHSPYNPPEPFHTKYKNELYNGEVAYTDSQLARLFAWLKEPPHNVYDDTVIVFLSDHGESLGEHGEKEHGFFVYDATVHIPLIVKPAKRGTAPLEREIGPAVESVQVAPTVLELAGLHDPIEKQFEASSLVAMITGKNTAPARAAYSESVYPRNSFGWSALHSLQTEQYQYVEAPQQELYDLQSDPAEKTNIEEKNASVAGRLRTELDNRLEMYRASGSNGDENANGASPEVLEKLRSLGYVAYKAPPAAGTKLADPKDKVRIFQDVLHATDLMQAGKFSLAGEVLGKLAREEPHLYLIPFLEGESAERQERWGEAEKRFGRALELNPGFEDATMGLARALGYEGKTGQASGLIQALVKTNAQNFRAWFLLAQIEAKSDAKASRAALDQVIAIQPNFAPAYQERGMFNVQEQNYEAGAEDLGQAVKLGMTDAATYNFLGICYSRLGQLDNAVESYQKALEADPKMAQAHLNLGFAYERMSNLPQARQEYQEACRLDARICAMVAGHMR